MKLYYNCCNMLCRTIRKKTLCLIFFFIFLGAADSQDSSRNDDRIKIVTAIAPLEYLVKGIGGDRIIVQTILPSTQAPETFDPQPSDITMLLKSDLYIAAGFPFENKLIDLLSIPVIRSYLAAEHRSFTINEEHEHDEDNHDDHDKHEEHDDHDHEKHDEHEEHDEHAEDNHDDHDKHEEHEEHDEEHEEHEEHDDHGHAHDEDLDPHIWLGPKQMRQQIPYILSELSAIDPAGKNYYSARAETLHDRISELEHQIAEKLQNMRGTAFLCYHPAYGYFADAFGLVQYAIEAEAREASPQRLLYLNRLVQELDIQTILVTPQFSQRSAEVIARATQTQYYVIDILQADWEKTMHELADVILNAE